MITGAEELRVKESDRIATMAKELVSHGCADRRAARWHGHPGLGRQEQWALIEQHAKAMETMHVRPSPSAR